MLIWVNLLTIMDVMLNTFVAQCFVPLNKGTNASVESGNA